MNPDADDSKEKVMYPAVFDPSPWAESTAEELDAAEADALAALVARVGEEARDRLLGGVNFEYKDGIRESTIYAIDSSDPELARLIGIYKSIRIAAEIRRMDADDWTES